MDKAFEMIQQDDVLSGMRHLVDDLHLTRSRLAQPEWESFAKVWAMSHPIREIVHLCPMTRRSFDKPRGYAGDAVMLDHIYGIEHPGPDYHPATLAGKIYAYTINAPASSTPWESFTTPCAISGNWERTPASSSWSTSTPPRC